MDIRGQLRRAGPDATRTTTYGYNSTGQLSDVDKSPAGVDPQYIYNTLGQVDLVTYANANRRDLNYDKLHRLSTDQLKTSGGTQIGKITYGYDAAGNRLMWTGSHDDVVAQFGATATTLAGSASYDPFGAVVAATGLIGSLGYQSGYTDQLTGRVNMHARWYNPDTGQFDTRDTMAQSAVPASVNANRYAYANANPLSHTDPTGHWALEGNDIEVETRYGGVVTNDVWTRQDYYATLQQIQANRAAAEQRQQLIASLGPCANNAAWGRGVCAAAPTVNEINCQPAHVDRTVQKLIMGEITQTKTFANCTTMVVTSDGTAYINGLAFSASTFSTKVTDTTTGGQVTYTATPYDLAQSVDARVGRYGGYDPAGTNRAALTVLVLDDAIGSAYTKSQARQEAQREAECQKSFMCRNADWISFGIGLALAIGCGVVTAGVGAVACLVIAGAIVNIGNEVMKNNIHSFNDVLTAGLTGAARGLLDAATGGIGGKLAGAVIGAAATKVGAKVAAAAGGAIGGGASAALYDLVTTGNINLSNVALGAVFGAAGGYAGAKLGCLGHSFSPGTQVLMADGTTKPIEDIRAGDEVTAPTRRPAPPPRNRSPHCTSTRTPTSPTSPSPHRSTTRWATTRSRPPRATGAAAPADPRPPPCTRPSTTRFGTPPPAHGPRPPTSNPASPPSSNPTGGHCRSSTSATTRATYIRPGGRPEPRRKLRPAANTTWRCSRSPRGPPLVLWPARPLTRYFLECPC